MQQHPHLPEWLHIAVLMQFPASLVLDVTDRSVYSTFSFAPAVASPCWPAEACRKLLLQIRGACMHRREQHSYSRTCKAAKFHSIGRVSRTRALKLPSIHRGATLRAGRTKEICPVEINHEPRDVGVSIIPAGRLISPMWNRQNFV